MDAIYKMMNSATKLEIIAENGTDELLRTTAKEVAAELMAVAQFAAPRWGTLLGIIKDLEKGK